MIFVTVGTDHHRFDRLLDWVERWAADHDVDVVVQHGASRVPTGVDARDFLPVEAMADHFRRADAVVCGGGPGTVMSARDCGCIPIVVPRTAAHGEVVDDHQHAFAEVLAEEGMARVAHDEAELVGLLDAASADPAAFRFDPGTVPPPAGVARTGELIDELLARRRAAPRRRHRLLSRLGRRSRGRG